MLPPRVMADPGNAASSVQPGRLAPSVIKRAAALRGEVPNPRQAASGDPKLGGPAP